MNNVMEKQVDGTWNFVIPAPESKDTQMLKQMGFQEAELQQLGFLDKFARTEVAGIPIGAAVIGAGITILADRIILAKLTEKSPEMRTWINLGAALVVKQFGSRFLGSKTADVTALLLVYEAVADTVSNLINKVWPPAALSAGQQVFGLPVATGQNVGVRQEPDYYAKAWGR